MFRPLNGHAHSDAGYGIRVRLHQKRILITGATGKVGQAFIARLLGDTSLTRFSGRALCHNRRLPPAPRLEVLTGSIAERSVAEEAVRGVSHVLHLATSKENSDTIMDVAVKGMFFLLEACRRSPTFEQFILVGGDASVGHCYYPHPAPVTETQRHSAYPGCYALSKVLEEVMLEQYYLQYDLNGCCLRAPWIMEKDDFKQQLSFGEDVFGGPRWCDLVGPDRARRYRETQTVPVMTDAQGRPVRRNFVHVDDLIEAVVSALDHPAARQQTFNVSMDEPVDYGALARYLKKTRGLPSVEVQTDHHSTWLDNSKAKLLLGWRPRYDLERLVESAFGYQRAAGDPRVVWYPG